MRILVKFPCAFHLETSSFFQYEFPHFIPIFVLASLLLFYLFRFSFYISMWLIREKKSTDNTKIGIKRQNSYRKNEEIQLSQKSTRKLN
jgi:hypothetical protein